MAANAIGNSVKTKEIDPVTHKRLHAFVGGASGAVLSKDVGSGIVSGALGALTDILSPTEEIQKKVKKLENEKGRILTPEEFASVAVGIATGGSGGMATQFDSYITQAFGAVACSRVHPLHYCRVRL